MLNLRINDITIEEKLFGETELRNFLDRINSQHPRKPGLSFIFRD